MKTFSVVLVAALLCAVVVCAKPSPTSEINEINKAIHNMFRSYRCAHSLVDHSLIVERAKERFEKEFNEFNTTAESILAKKCILLQGKEKFTCAMEVSRVFLNSYEDFLNKVQLTSAPLAKKMEEFIKYQCDM